MNRPEPRGKDNNTGGYRVFIYKEPRSRALDIEKIYHYVETKLPQLSIELRGDFIHHYLSTIPVSEKENKINLLAYKFAQLRISDPHRKQVEKEDPLAGETNFEKKRLQNFEFSTSGILYQGEELMHLLRELLWEKERNLNNIHIIYTNQLLGSWNDEDKRYHARVSLYGFPNLISTTGVVAAPAKPREYYLLRKTMSMAGNSISPELSQQYSEECLSKEDPRLTEVLKGYALQAVFYHFTGNPFCTDPYCRLYNGHWQKEVIRAQLEGERELCPYHDKVLLSLGREDLT